LQDREDSMMSSENGIANAAAISLQSDEMEVMVIPGEGGRIASLRSVSSGLEFLTQARPDRQAIKPSLETAFQRGPCAGAEECLPTVGPCVDCTGGPAPDHGDFWQIPWSVDSLDSRKLQMHAVGFSRPLRFERIISVDGASLSLNYRVVNFGSKAYSFLYAWHPLFAVETGDRVVLPTEVAEVRLSYSRGHALGPEGKPLKWPELTSSRVIRDLSVACDPHHETAEMIYTRRLHVGRCGLFRGEHRQGVIISFDPSQLPYLGVWLCFGGWPVAGPEAKQVAVALEPTNAPFNTLSEAEHAGLAVRLAPGHAFTWNIEVDLTPRGVSYEEFRACVRLEESQSFPHVA
jgi:galactose mutarotase-like enzyme